jgi:serine/threonine protein kinase
MKAVPLRSDARNVIPARACVPRAYRVGDWIVGRYRLERRIGTGAMGSVWQARDKRTGVRVAIKLLRDHTVGALRDYLSARLSREAATLAGLRHESIVRVIEFGASTQDEPYIAMELLEGESLGALLARSDPLVAEYAVQLLLPIARGLAAAHDFGVVHRDLKPDNIFLAIDGRLQPKLIDFGLVKLTRAPSPRKLTGIGLLGTPDYMAPEQALERPDVDHRSDIWSFAVVLYEALSGRLPFGGSTFAESLYARIEGDARPLTDFGIDPALWQIVERGLGKQPEDRWPSMHEFGAALAKWLVARGVTVDVTGAELVMNEIDAAPEDAGDPPSDRYGAERSSGVHLRQERGPQRARATSRSRTKLRWALSGVIAAALLAVSGAHVLADGARALTSLAAGSYLVGAR